MNEQLKDALFNYKFEQATNHLRGEPDNVKELVESLSYVFSNIGWFEGDLAAVIKYALISIGIENEPEEPSK